jgi:hypothetical protein
MPRSWLRDIVRGSFLDLIIRVKPSAYSGAAPEKQNAASIRRAPAVQALLLQVLSLIFVALLDAALAAFAHVAMSPLAFACAQGVCAALLAKWRRLASWWFAIQLLFPVALVLLLSLRLPPWIFLVAFLFFVLLYWSSFRTQVPFYPSGPAVWEAVAQLLPQERAFDCIDIGSGLGGLALHLARRFPQGRISGVELAPLPWAISALRARVSGSGARFCRQDYNALNLADYDIVFAYLSPAAMPALWSKARSEMRKGSMLISYEFAVPDVAPSMTISPRANGPELHIFHL